MSKLSRIAALIQVSGALAMGQTATSGGFRGTVTDSQANPIVGAQVRYARILRTVPDAFGHLVLAPGEVAAEGLLPSIAGGAFSASSLPVGDYYLCATVPSAPYLDPCRWGTPTRLTVSASAVAASPTIALIKGVYLSVNVNDPQGLIPAAQVLASQSAKLRVGLFYANGAYLGLPETLSGGIHTYQAPIPVGTPMNLWLFSTDVVLTDANGNPISPSTGYRAPFQATAGQDQAFAFTVVGPAPAVETSDARRR